MQLKTAMCLQQHQQLECALQILSLIRQQMKRRYKSEKCEDLVDFLKGEDSPAKIYRQHNKFAIIVINQSCVHRIKKLNYF